MKYVLDSNIAVKWMLPEPDSAEALDTHQIAWAANMPANLQAVIIVVLAG